MSAPRLLREPWQRAHLDVAVPGTEHAALPQVAVVDELADIARARSGDALLEQQTFRFACGKAAQPRCDLPIERGFGLLTACTRRVCRILFVLFELRPVNQPDLGIKLSVPVE